MQIDSVATNTWQFVVNVVEELFRHSFGVIAAATAFIVAFFVIATNPPVVSIANGNHLPVHHSRPAGTQIYIQGEMPVLQCPIQQSGVWTFPVSDAVGKQRVVTIIVADLK